jgi:threonine aldolase
MPNNKVVDLRSDTVTLPTPAMREAISHARLGDDVYGEDPTVKRLEQVAAELLGKEAGLLVPSGTMANLVCLLSHCRRGDEAIMGHMAHTFLFEGGASAAVGGIHPRTVVNQLDGTLDIEEVEAAIRDPMNTHYPRTRLICLENTHNRCGGTVLTPLYTSRIRALADEYGLALHLDGARIFNAAVALGVDVSELARDADSVSFCLSKGLSAPVGSLVCGSGAFIWEARRQRKLLGGGMRQAGVLAAAGLVALEQMVDRLAEDHVNAARLAAGLVQLPLIDLDVARVQTNIVIFDLAAGGPSPSDLVQALSAQRIRIGAIGGRRFRAVTHYGIEPEDIEYAISTFRRLLSSER